MISLLVIVSFVFGAAYKAIRIANKMYKDDRINYIKYSETEAETKCTIEDYKYFELAK